MAHDDLPSTTRIAPSRRGERLTSVRTAKRRHPRWRRRTALALLFLLLGVASCFAVMHLRG